MQKAEHDIRKMMQGFGQDTPTVPAIPDEDTKRLRRKLIDEEVNLELIPAINDDDLQGIFDGGIDAIVVILGTLVAYGLPAAKGWEEVLRSNLAKIDPTTGKVIKRPDGKVLKPEGWTAPDLGRIIQEALAGTE